jgi:hypothetical protein
LNGWVSWQHRLPYGVSGFRQTAQGFEASVLIPADEEGFFGRQCPDRPDGPRKPRLVDLTPEHGELAQEEDLGILSAVGAGVPGKPAEHPKHRQVSDS